MKNNHLALLGDDEATAALEAIARVWPLRRRAGFIEVEVRGKDSALAAARAFREMRRGDGERRRNDERHRIDEQYLDDQQCRDGEGDSVPCLLMLDNTSPEETARIVMALRDAELLDELLLEASGNISEGNAEAYAASGVDAISIGALTHSSRALDLCQRFS